MTVLNFEAGHYQNQVHSIEQIWADIGIKASNSSDRAPKLFDMGKTFPKSDT